MKLTPVQGPAQVKQVVTNESAAKAKAVAAFNANQSQPAETTQQTDTQAPIPVNANNILAEEVSAVTTGQNRSDVADTTTPPQSQAEENIQTQTPPPAEKRDDSSALQLLARKERQLRAQAQKQNDAIKAEREQMKQQTATLEQRIKELEANSIPKQRIKEQAYQVLEEEGVTYDTITQQAIDAQNKNPRYEAYINKLEAKIAKLEEKATQSEQNQQEQSAAQYKAALKQIETDVVTLVKTDPNFEAIRATNSIKDVVELIEATFKEEGRVMSVDEAAEEVENYLVDELTRSASSVNKVKKRLGSQQATGNKQTQTQNKPQQTQQMKTLTNAAASTRKLTAKERAVLAFKGELKS